MRQYTTEYSGNVTINDDGSIIVTKENGVEIFLNTKFEIMVLSYEGKKLNDMHNYMSFNTFQTECTNTPAFTTTDGEMAFFGWLDIYNILADNNHEPTCTIDNLLWEKTFIYENAVTQKEKDLTCGGWHVFTDGKTHAIIWSSEGKCNEIVPLIGYEIISCNCEFAVIKL